MSEPATAIKVVPDDLMANVRSPAAKPIVRSADHPTGIAGVDSGATVCAAGTDGVNCFLDRDQRSRLENLLTGAVSTATASFLAALGVSKVKKQLKKTDELPWYMTLVLAGVGTVVEAGLAGALKGLKQGIAPALPRAGIKLEGDLARAVQGVSLPEVTSVTRRVFHSIGGAVDKKELGDVVAKFTADKGKEAIKAVAGRQMSLDSEDTQQKESELSYYGQLEKQFKKQFLDVVPAAMASSDAELVAIYQSFMDLDRHSTERYEQEIDAAVARYSDSAVSDMGRRLAWDHKRGDKQYELETRVAWLVTHGARRRLIFVDRAFSAAYQLGQQRALGHGSVSRSSAYDSGANQLSLRDDATWTAGGKSEMHREEAIGPDMMINYVEPEFIELALQKQEQIWLAPPETFMMDYSYMPPRMVKVAS